MQDISLKLPTVNILQVGLACPFIFKQSDYKSLSKDLYSVYQSDTKLYKDTLESFLSFISQAVIREALRTNQIILSFESYFYRTVLSYCESNSIQDPPKIASRAWIKIEQVYLKLKEFVQSSDIIEVTYLDKYHLRHPHNNYTVKPFSYSLDSIITIKDSDGFITLVEIFPKEQEISSLYNLSALKYFGSKLKTLVNICFNSSSIFTYFHIKQYDVPKLLKIFNTLIVNFDYPSLGYCSSCPAKEQCTSKMKTEPFIKTFNPYTFNKR